MANARDWIVSGQKAFPWDANHFLMMGHKLPETAIVTMVFLEYSANDVPLTAIACKEVLWHGEINQVMAGTQAKLRECRDVEQRLRVPPPLFRQAEFARIDLNSATQGKFVEEDITDYLLKMWAKIHNLLMIHEEMKTRGNDTLVRVDEAMEKTLQKRLERLDDLLRRAEHLDEVRRLAELARPPGVKEHQIEETV
jgi:hypothetical protein